MEQLGVCVHTRVINWVTLFTAFKFGLAVLSGQAAAQGQGSTLANDCASELARHCSSITPGDGRMIACLISHSDKLAPRCRLTAFLAGKSLAKNLARLERLAFICGADINSLCHSILPGGGRIYDCLRKNRVRLVPRCREALPTFEKEYLSR